MTRSRPSSTTGQPGGSTWSWALTEFAPESGTSSSVASPTATQGGAATSGGQIGTWFSGTETTEYWGAGELLGHLSPAESRVCVILGVPVDVLRPDQPHGRTERLVALLEGFGVPVADYTADLPDDSDPLFLWPMADVRAPHWVRGRTALVGDAAAAFLPTAGIGASMALESAAALADELSRTDSTYVPNALELYERRRRTRVEAAQTQSRRLARLMFVRSHRLAAVRDRALKHASMEQMTGPLIKALRQPI